MKKLLLFAVLALFSFNALNAQVKFGAKAGVNFSDITGEMVDSFNGRTSIHFGVMSEFTLSDMFALQPELLYSSQGSDYEEEEFSGTVKVDYLNIPVMAKIYVADGFFFQAGPQVGFLLSATDEYDDEEDDIKDFLKGTDFGFNLGLGYKLDSGLQFDARYNIGLSDNLDVGSSEFEGEGAEYKNSVIQISIGWFF
ncbi:MAG: PorT family protein [Eudoraea sp.]|nr:PorT family protein [Eudoraea sp.]